MEIIERPSPNFGDRKGRDVSFIILHYTGMEDAEGALSRLCDPSAEVSAHYTIDTDGTMYRHVDEAMRAWHAGKGQWGEESDINSVSIGIELVNPGHAFGYTDFPPAQIEQTIGLCRDIASRHDIEWVLGHSDVAPDRKTDPGEKFPWAALAKAGVGAFPAASDEDMVKAVGIDVIKALRDYGYNASKRETMIRAFQRHYVPEVFAAGTDGAACHKTKARLYALLAGHLISPQK
jgi:N-acetylmuramoyl-L-alanine amidase